MNVIIITGASSGMGAEFAAQLDNVFNGIDEFWLIARREKELTKISQDLKHTARVIAIDITNKEGIDKFYSLLKTKNPVIRMLVNCAGYGILGEFAPSDIQTELGMIDLNCKALTEITYLCIPYMKKNSRIIQLASSAAFLPQPNFAVYAASKSYVYSFSRALNRELKEKEIYVTAVCPGPVDTPFFDIAERTGSTLTVKKLTMVKADKVVQRAIQDSYNRHEKSVYGFPIKAFELIAKIIPHHIILSLFKHM